MNIRFCGKKHDNLNVNPVPSALAKCTVTPDRSRFLEPRTTGKKLSESRRWKSRKY